MKLIALALLLCSMFLSTAFSAGKSAGLDAAAPAWSPQAAAQYLDARQKWWQYWPVSQRDHQTVCVSCHTALPFALARPSLRQSLKETAPSSQEEVLLGYIKKRVGLWNEVAPFYIDGQDGPHKSSEARGTEAVLNALILARHDMEEGKSEDITRRAFENMWALQLKSGAWDWLNFHLAPWESDTAQYYGVTLAAIAVGTAPRSYFESPERQENVKQLASYLTEHFSSQPEANKIVLLWAAAKLPNLLPPEQRASLLDSVYTQQRADGGWSLASLGPWKRLDKSTLPVISDGYATGLTVFSLEQAGVSHDEAHLSRGLAWLVNNQNKTTGQWPAYSMNKERKPTSDVGRFMSDAATGYAVLALEGSR